jgi:prolyl-tRNA editing enzyme YbaK/EbsC (Cys-tRNA(Pro) deacylase)
VGEPLPASAQKVRDALAGAGVTAQVRQLPEAARTATAAAEALGCEVGAIANSLIFMAGGNWPLLVMTSGAHRVDVGGLAWRLGKALITRATPDQVRAATGQTIGGVAPIGHPAPIETIVDSDLQRYEQIWAAGGYPAYGVPHYLPGTAAAHGRVGHARRRRIIRLRPLRDWTRGRVVDAG